jgi:tetratricopeptide (TPR) repeat protein
LELQADLEGNPILQADDHLGFEVYNCLGMLYGYLNHAGLSLQCFDIADSYVDRLADPKLEAKQLVDRSYLYQFSDFAKWSELTEDAQKLNAKVGTVRHRRHADTTMLSLEFLLLRDSEAELQRISRDLDNTQKDCEAASYFSLMPRVYVLRAAIAYTLATQNLSANRHDETLLGIADQAANHGLGIGIERGIGFASWQLRNLKAMIALRRGNYIAAKEHFQAAFEIMRTDGLLFLGNADLTCPNQIVLANYIKLLHSMGSDQDIKHLLREVRTYEKADWNEDDDYDYAVKTALVNDALLGRFRVESGLPRDEKNGLGLVVWL